MSPLSKAEPFGKDYRPVRQVLVSVLVANLLVTAIKIMVGLASGALAIVADGFHSLVDSSSNLIGLAAIRFAQRPPDSQHPYGYRRYETLGALAIGGMLLVAAWEIGSAVVERFLEGGSPTITPVIIGIVIFTFPINVAIVILEKRAGKRLQSEILMADAKHTQTDLYVTLSVIGSLIGVQLGWGWLDYAVAAAVVGMIVKAAFEILGETAQWLTDVAIVDPVKIEEIAYQAPGVQFVHNVRSRGAPDAAFVDLHVKVDPGMSAAQSHAIASQIERRLIAEIDDITDALVHIEPASQANISLWTRIANDLRSIADGLGLGAHDLHIHSDTNGRYAIELHLEMPQDMLLGEAHQLADQFEAQVHKRWPQTDHIITHMEPIPDKALLPGGAPADELIASIRAVILAHVAPPQLHNLKVFLSGDHLHASAALALPADISLTSAHSLTEHIETELLNQIPTLGRVTFHVEPYQPTKEDL